VQSPDFSGVRGDSYRPAQPFSVLPGLDETSPSSLAQNFPFELSEDSQQARHGSAGWCGQIKRLRSGNEPDAKVLQLLKGRQKIRYRPAPAVEPPYQHQIDLPAAGGIQQFFACFALRRAGSDLADL
jgi:hypothetical protein